MANRDIPIDLDAFASALDSLIADLPESVSAQAEKAVGKSVRYGAKFLRETATRGKTEWSERYSKGFASRTSKNGLQSEGEIGNRSEPGLVHLLEKGHLTLTGRRTNAYPHMDPAFEETSEYFIREMGDAVDRAIR